MKLDSHIVELIYDIPLGKSNWHQVVEELRIEMKAAIAALFLAKPNQEPIVVSTSENDPLWKPYSEYYSQIDPWNEALASPGYKMNTIRYGRAILPEKEFKKTEYYHDFWKAFGLGETIGGLLVTKCGITVQIGLPREIDAKYYNNREVRLLRYYCKHIIRAIELEGYIGSSLPQGIYESGLSAKFGLTQAEAQLVLTLFKVNSLQQAAITLSRSYHTARTQLKSVFKKTETSNQIELIKRLISN